MPNMVTINDAPVDMDDPCAMATALRKLELQVVTGSGVVMTRFGDDEVRWSAANLGRLRDLIDDYERRCNLKNGIRTRYAKRMRFVR
ncbi:MAG: hypothetical protein WBB98_13485 [Xanthobacteraceae bacterium]